MSDALFVSTLVSTAGEDRREVLEGFADPLILFWQSCRKGKKVNMGTDEL